VEFNVHDPWLVRRLPGLLDQAGFEPELRLCRDPDARQTPTIVDRGADALVAAGRIGEATTAALKAGARQRIAEGRLFGHVAYASLVARLPN
jgi:hypothetical protein